MSVVCTQPGSPLLSLGTRLMLPVIAYFLDYNGILSEQKLETEIKGPEHGMANELPLFFLTMVLPGMSQLTRKSPIALRLILRGSLGPTA